MKERLSPSSINILEEFINSVRPSEMQIKIQNEAYKRHVQESLFLYDAGKRLLDTYGKTKNKQIKEPSGWFASNIGVKVTSTRLKAVNFRCTPEVPIETEKEVAQLMVVEDFTVKTYSTEMDRIVIKAFLDEEKINKYNGKEFVLFDISTSGAFGETKNWLGEKATPEQMEAAKQLFLDIKRSLEEKSHLSKGSLSMRKNVCSLTPSEEEVSKHEKRVGDS